MTFWQVAHSWYKLEDCQNTCVSPQPGLNYFMQWFCFRFIHLGLEIWHVGWFYSMISKKKYMYFLFILCLEEGTPMPREYPRSKNTSILLLLLAFWCHTWWCSGTSSSSCLCSEDHEVLEIRSRPPSRKECMYSAHWAICLTLYLALSFIKWGRKPEVLSKVVVEESPCPKTITLERHGSESEHQHRK